MDNQIFGREDFSSGRAFDTLGIAQMKDRAEKESRMLSLRENAKNVGIPAKSFQVMYSAYIEKQRKADSSGLIEIPGGYNISPWTIKSDGTIYKVLGEMNLIACSHPIYINQTLTNLITGERKVELGFSRDGGESWKHIIVNRSLISSANSIVQLSELGISVTSSNARNLVTYLQNFEDNNFDSIPEISSVNRFGWIGENSFSPYAEEDGIMFDSSESFRELREAVEPTGNYQKWLSLAQEIRKNGSVEANLALAASFAAPLVGKLKCLPFFLHLWGGTGNGKTAALMLAASVWANPSVGKYIKTFNSTAVGQETIAGTLYSMPLILDELQSINDRRDFDKMVYGLTEGTGRARGTAVGGLRPTLTWKNCIISSGEQPITRVLSGGGAKNRMTEVICRESIFEDPINLLDVISCNYGHAGKEWVEKLTQAVVKEAGAYRLEIFHKLVQEGYTEKQSLSASLILTADKYAGRLLFSDSGALSVKQVSQYLLKESDVSKEIQSYEWLRGWIVQNGAKFDENSLDVYGKFLADGSTAIISNVLREACEKENISLEVLTEYLERIGMLEKDPNGKRAKVVKMNGKAARCYVVLETFEDGKDD